MSAIRLSLVLFVLAGPLFGQAKPLSRPPAAGSLQVFLITFGEGELYFEKFGHNALWFRDSTRGIDAAYNWGTFDFEEPGFLRKLLMGDQQYWVEGYPGEPLMNSYRRRDRSIVVQRLNLTPEQAQKAYDFTVRNAREENKFYRYDYFRDNCSTRVRDVIDLALGGALKSATANDTVPRSYRSETLRMVDDLKFTQGGIDAALGRPSDQPLSVWENMFAPSRLKEALRDQRVDGQPVVAEERVVYQTKQHQERGDAPKLWLPYLIAGVVIAAGIFATALGARRSPALDKIFRFEVTLWALATGLLGLILLLAWLITKHVFWYRNENLLVFNPLSLFLAVLALLSIFRSRWTKPAAICAVIVALLTAAALQLKGLMGSQDNLPLILLVLPAHFAVAYGLWRLASAPPAPSTETSPL